MEAAGRYDLPDRLSFRLLLQDTSYPAPRVQPRPATPRSTRRCRCLRSRSPAWAAHELRDLGAGEPDQLDGTLERHEHARPGGPPASCVDGRIQTPGVFPRRCGSGSGRPEARECLRRRRFAGDLDAPPRGRRAGAVARRGAGASARGVAGLRLLRCARARRRAAPRAPGRARAPSRAAPEAARRQPGLRTRAEAACPPSLRLPAP